MAYKTGILLGQITRISGSGGTVTIRLEKTLVENVPLGEWVFLEIEGKPVPFFISAAEFSGTGLLKLSFEGYRSHEKMNVFIGSRVYSADTRGYEHINEELQTITGFCVINQDNELIGEICEIISNPAQLLLKINSPGNREILVPLHEHFILSIDRRKKQIIMNIPEGLTEIN